MHFVDIQKMVNSDKTTGLRKRVRAGTRDSCCSRYRDSALIESLESVSELDAMADGVI